MTTLLLSVEGSDGTGKETQSRLLKELFELQEKTVATISFPRYKQTAGGWSLWEALKGENSSAYNFVNVDPYSASLFYAADRKESISFLRRQIETHDIVIFDRYVESNLLHQGGKFKTEKDRNEFADFLYILEYKMLKLPAPQITIYLDLPCNVAMDRAKKRAEKEGKEPDAVERNHDYIKNSHESGLFYASKFGWLVVPCVRSDGYEFSPKEVHDLIVSGLQKKFGLDI